MLGELGERRSLASIADAHRLEQSLISKRAAEPLRRRITRR